MLASARLPGQSQPYLGMCCTYPDASFLQKHPYLKMLHIADWDPAEEDHPSTAATKAKGLIVAASLLDKAPNLAGLARTAEALGAEALTLPDLKLTKTPLFESVSVTAQHWVDMREVCTYCKPDAVPHVQVCMALSSREPDLLSDCKTDWVRCLHSFVLCMEPRQLCSEPKPVTEQCHSSQEAVLRRAVKAIVSIAGFNSDVPI